MPAYTQLVGDWLLQGKLGQGGFGEVLHWINRTTKQEIATKHIKDADKMSADQQLKMKQRWQQEYNWTRDLQQPHNIVAGVQLGKGSAAFVEHINNHHIWKLPVIILEYCNGGDVRKLLQRPQNANGLSEFEVREILGSLRRAIEFLHTRCKICHRDLKPDNIVIHRPAKGRTLYKLTDFGLARSKPDKTMLQSVVGTRHYYAPEVVDTGIYNMNVDYWSLGIIAYEIACGVLPFIAHQKPFTIQVNILKKPRECIAITECPDQADTFQFHKELPVGHHLSGPWATEFTKWLPLALETKYEKRGVLVATDEVQSASTAPVIFTEIDRLLKIRVLTLFAVCSYKLLEYELTPHLTMKELCEKVVHDTDLESTENIFFVLPTGHPLKQLTSRTQPLDLFVEDWCDTSEESNKPPVMVYIFNTMQNCQNKSTAPHIPTVLQCCLDSRVAKPANWLMDRMVLDMHHMLAREQTFAKTQLLGYKEYALTLEDFILRVQPDIQNLVLRKEKCCGAMEHFQILLNAAQQQQKIHLHNDGEWQSNWKKLCIKHKETSTSIGKLVHHYESTLHNVRDVSIKESIALYDKIIKDDVFKLKSFRKRHVRRGDSLSCEELSGIAVDYAKTRHIYFDDAKIKCLTKSNNYAHLRYIKILETLGTADKNLSDIQDQLLQLQLQMLPSAVPIQQPPIFQMNNAMSQLNFDAPNGHPTGSLDAFDCLSTDNVIVEALRLQELLESDMDIDRTGQT